LLLQTNRLVESSKISLDDKLSKYIPDFPDGDYNRSFEKSSFRVFTALYRANWKHFLHFSPKLSKKVKQAKLGLNPERSVLIGLPDFPFSTGFRNRFREKIMPAFTEYVFAHLPV